MENILNICDPRELHRVVDFVHDCWFDLDRIFFDSQTRTIQIPFAKSENQAGKGLLLPKKLKKVDEVKYLLEIKYVKEYDIDDTEKIGLYDFNVIEYDENNKRIKISTGVPLGFMIHVSDFELSVRKQLTLPEEVKEVGSPHE